jgi:hypothetical protein
MDLNIGLYLQRSEGPIRKSEVLVRKSDILVRTSNQKGIKVEDSFIALVTPFSTLLKQKQILLKSVINLLIYKRNTL